MGNRKHTKKHNRFGRHGTRKKKYHTTKKRHVNHKKHRTTKKKLKPVKCSPTSNKSYTCYSDDSLEYIKKMWNKRHPDNKIEASESRDIWKKMRENLANSCNRESCWIRQKFIKKKLNRELLSYTFAPKAPVKWRTNPNEWLTSIDIIKVMKQYEKKYRCFDFIGPSPIDYDHHKMYGECVWEELCNFDLTQQLKSGKSKIGIIFNLDPHYLEGSHWVSLFMDLKRNFIYYFDSVGDKIPKRIMKFVNKIKSQGSSNGMDFDFKQNTVEHQKKNTECGVYSLFFIIEMLKKEKPYMFTEVIPDDKMEKFRKEYFNIYT